MQYLGYSYMEFFVALFDTWDLNVSSLELHLVNISPDEGGLPVTGSWQERRDPRPCHMSSYLAFVVGVPTSFVVFWKLESFWKRELQLRKCPH